MKVLLMSPLVQYSGNFATVSRIKKGLEKNGLQCYLKSPFEFSNCTALENLLEKLQINIIIAVHVYKSGKLLVDTVKPYILILGGTDVNEFTADIEKMDLMTKVVNNSRHVVAFGDSLAEKFKFHWPSYNHSNISIIPQGVEVYPSSFSLKDYIQASTELGTSQPGQDDEICCADRDILLRQLLASEAKIFTVIGGIRQVKNPLYLMKTFSEWRQITDRKDSWLLFVGAHQNDAFFKGFKEEVHRCPGVVYIPGLSAEDTHAVIRDSFALVNSSDSEGMALAILEAMSLKTPVLVRNIPGNTVIVQDGQTGLIYDTPEMFLEKAESLLDKPDLVAMITDGAFNYISKSHSVEYEERAYFTLVKQFC